MLTAPGTREAILTVRGEMGMRDQRHVDMKLDLKNMPVAPWLPIAWRGEIRGEATGQVIWKGDDQTLASSHGEGELEIRGARLQGVPALEFVAAAAASKALKSLDLDTCRVAFRWKGGRFEVTSMDLEDRGKASVRGALTVSGSDLRGEVDFGVAPEFLEWLPRAEEAIFTRREAGLVWTKVRIFGTVENPENDLTPRLVREVRRDPAAAAGMLLRGAGEWIEQKVRGDDQAWSGGFGAIGVP